MKILGVLGSLREESNTNKLVEIVARSSGCEYELVDLGKMKIAPCRGCLHCMFKKGVCAIDDDMPAINQKLIDSDGLVLGSPTYNYDISGAVKCFIDRTMAMFYREIGPLANPDMPWLGQRPLAGKVGVPVCTAAGGGHERALETLAICMEQVQRMTLPAKIKEIVGIDDVNDMPEVQQRSEQAGQALGKALNAKK